MTDEIIEWPAPVGFKYQPDRALRVAMNRWPGVAEDRKRIADLLRLARRQNPEIARRLQRALRLTAEHVAARIYNADA